MNPISFLVQEIMLPLLKFFYDSIFPNYGVAIILLTILVKAIFYPLTNKQFKSMKAMQKIQPKLKEIQAKHKKTPEKLQKEMIALYREHNVNPLGGCLPLLIQLPFLIALFYTLMNPEFNELLKAAGSGGTFLWIKDLAAPDKTLVLPTLVAASTYFSQKMMHSADAGKPTGMMATMNTMMPMLMFFISLRLYAGVLIYWAVSQGLTALQQYYMMRQDSGGKKTIKNPEVVVREQTEKELKGG